MQCNARTLTLRLGQAPRAFLEDVIPLERPAARAPCNAQHLSLEDVVSARQVRGQFAFVG